LKKYNSTEAPPAPMVEVKGSNPYLRVSEKARAKLDTGASMSVIPQDWVERLRLMPLGVIDVSGFDEEWREVRTYMVDLAFDGFRFDWVEVIASRRDNVLIGRDILNHLKITLDGKNLTLNIEDP